MFDANRFSDRGMLLNKSNVIISLHATRHEVRIKRTTALLFLPLTTDMVATAASLAPSGAAGLADGEGVAVGVLFDFLRSGNGDDSVVVSIKLPAMLRLRLSFSTSVSAMGNGLENVFMLGR